MRDWIKCTSADGGEIYVNMTTALTMMWNDNQGFTVIGFPGGVESAVHVKETPEEVMALRIIS